MALRGIANSSGYDYHFRVSISKSFCFLILFVLFICYSNGNEFLLLDLIDALAYICLC